MSLRDNKDIWITGFVMLIVFLIVCVVKCIPKSKLPYCLGGDLPGERFVCPLRYEDWCNDNGFVVRIPSHQLVKMKNKDAMEITARNNGLASAAEAKGGLR